MNSLEIKIMDDKLNPFRKNIDYWYRYVDDIICLWKGTNRQLDNFLDYLNSLHRRIKFTVEIEKDHCLNFLDLKISRTNGSHQFTIFRKPTSTDSIIPFNSCHPVIHKMAAFNSMVDRLMNVPSTEEDFNREKDIIKQIATNNGYNASIVEKIINKRLRSRLIKSIFPICSNENLDKSWITLPYVGIVSEKIGRALKKEGFKVSFSTKPLLNGLLNSSKDKIKPEEKSGIYKLNCDDCKACYVGQTGRKFKDRIAEHIHSWKIRKDDSNFANHLIETNHNFDKNRNVEFLHFIEKGQLMNVLEAFEIKRIEKDQTIESLNDQLNFEYGNIVNFFV